jgi:two-component system response regulator YesN
MRMQQRVRDAVRFVHDHHAEPLTLADVARTVGVGRFTLSHGFSATMRVSFRTYLVRVRVVRAAELLRRSSHSVIEISEMVGFGDLSRFNKAFKKHVGLPPTVYRRIAEPSGEFTALIAPTT